MKSIVTSIAALVFTSGALFTWSPAVDAQGQIIRCGASRGQEAFCPADTRNGVTLVRQLSRAGCWEGTTWGTSRRGIWVANGCRADFAVAERYVTRRQVYTQRRGSDDGRAAALALGILGIAAIAANRDDDRYDNYNRYSRDRYGRYHDQYWTPYDRNRPQLIRCESEDNQFRSCRADARRGVEIYRQISRTPCRFRTNWGYDARGIWVDRGCAADFVVRR